MSVHLYLDLVVRLAVVHTHNATDHFWHNDHITQVSLDTLLDTNKLYRLTDNLAMLQVTMCVDNYNGSGSTKGYQIHTPVVCV